MQRTSYPSVEEVRDVAGPLADELGLILGPVHHGGRGPEEQARVERIKQMTPAKIAPMAVALASDASAHVNGQIFAVRNNEIFLMSQPRPIRSVHRSEGWTPQSVLDQAMPALQSSFFDLERSGDVFSWDPI